jgi:hypothetical protein
VSKSNLEAAFLQAWRIYGRGFPDPVREYRFARVAIGDPPHPPARRNLRNRLAMAGLRDWKADFCWPDEALMVEIDGGQWAPGGGRHAGDDDKWKRNDAVLLGWRVLHYSGEMLKGDPAAVVAQVQAALLASDD